MTASQLNKFKKYWNEHYREEKKNHWGEREKGKGCGGITQEITEKNPPAFFKPKIRSLCLKMLNMTMLGTFVPQGVTSTL